MVRQKNKKVNVKMREKGIKNMLCEVRKTVTCQQCQWQWFTRLERPPACPNCKTVIWDEGPKPPQECFQCDYRWTPRKNKFPSVCPNCHSNNWWHKKDVSKS